MTQHRPTRRDFLKQSSAAIAAGALTGDALSANGPDAAAGRRPNVLLLFSDQHNADFLGCAGHRFVQTPNMDRLACEGVRFTRAYCQDGICVPSRTSMLTGQYPRTTGCIYNSDNPLEPHRLAPLQQVFQANGYRTGGFGKRHLPRGRIAGGWDRSATVISPKLDPSDENYWQWAAENGCEEAFIRDRQGCMNDDMGCHVSQLDPEDRLEAYTARKASEFMRGCAAEDKPFFCWAAFFGPHQPYTPPKKWADMYPVDSIPFPEGMTQPVEQLPTMLQAWRRRTKPPWNLAKAAGDHELYRRYIAYYAAQVTEVDHYMGQVLKTLDELGQRDNTIVIYASDHGDFVAAHGMIEKCAVGHNVYEETLRVPMIISWPGQFQTGATCDGLAELIDLYPTIVEQLGLDLPSHAPAPAGRSLVKTLADGAPIGREFAISENWSQVAVVTDRYKLGVWTDPTSRYRRWDYRGKCSNMLFDRENDPHELANRFGDASYREVQRRLRGYLDQWSRSTSDEGKRRIVG